MFKRLALLLILLCPFALPAAPAITVSGNSVTILGSAQTISLTCTLIDPNNTGNLRSGSNIITTFITSTATPSNVATCGPIYGNDVITDGYGNANTTYYRVQVFTVSGGIVASTPALSQFYAFTGSGTIDLATATPLAPSFFTGPTGNVVMPSTLTVTGASTFNGGLTTTTTTSTGAGSHSGTETFTGAPAISATNAGVFTNTQSQFYLQSLLNSCNPTTEFNVTQGGAGTNTTDALTGCVAIPVGSTVHQSNGLAGYASVSSASTNGVGVYGQSRCLVNNTNCWGANNLVQDFAGLTGHSMNGLEIDVNVLGTPTAARGLLIAGASTGTMPANSPAIAIGAPGTGKLWNTAISVTDAASVNGIAIGTTGTGNSVSSQPINLTGRDSGGVSHTTAIQADQFGNLSINAIAGKNVLIPTTTGLEIGEGAATAGGVGQDTCYGDSTLHMKKCSYNNGSFLPMPQTNNAGGTHSDSGLYQTKRAVAGCTTGAVAGNSCASDITVTWGTAFADANYSVTCTGSTPTNVPSAPFVVSATKLAATVHINYFAITAAAASYATIDCIAVHD